MATSNTHKNRKALKDLTNNNLKSDSNVSKLPAVKSVMKNKNNKKKKMDDEEHHHHRTTAIVDEEVANNDEDDDVVLDRLLLVQSDLSSLIHELDELVVQALKFKGTCKQGRKEIESFSHVLSGTLSSLKPWLPRLQKALLSSFVESEDQLEKPLSSHVPTAVNEEDDVGSPEERTTDLLLSPSPLVSWRANCTIDRSKQLFILTPLPLSKASSKQEGSSKPVKIALVPPMQPLPEGGGSGDRNDDLLVARRNPVPSPEVTKRYASKIVATPCFKTSSPRSCALLGPNSESCCHTVNKVRKSTPFPVGLKILSDSDSSDTSGGRSPKGPPKYPECLEIVGGSKFAPQRKNFEASPGFFFSPPKTCVLMQPPDGKSRNNQDDLEGKLALIKSTSTWKEPESMIRTGKRPGENTLKRELWEKFEAASSTGIGFKKASGFQRTGQKGFLELLEEASCDETSPVSKDMR